jgi:hypothetical protein
MPAAERRWFIAMQNRTKEMLKRPAGVPFVISAERCEPCPDPTGCAHGVGDLTAALALRA